MKKIEDEKLDKIMGGSVPPAWIFVIAAAVLVFLSGVIEGITNPEKCN